MPPTETTTDAPRELRPRPSREEIDPAAREIVRRYGDEVMASARHWAETPEDAEDAFQRGLEIMLTKAPSTDPDHLVPWLKTVVKREAWSIRRQRQRHTPPAPEYADLDSPGPATAHDLAERFERLQLGAEAMRRLKPQEIRALALKAEGLSYREICEETGWTYTKVNRCLSEGRRSFHDRLAGIESGAECERLAPQLSALADGEATAGDMTLLRPHLRTCLMCRARLRDYRAAPARVAALTPPVAAGGLLAMARDLLATFAVRWHHAAELAAGHKVAAVVASTAALAGGGAATVATVEDSKKARAETAVPKPQVDRGAAVPAARPTEPSVVPRRERPPSPSPANAAPTPEARSSTSTLAVPPSASAEFTPEAAAPSPTDRKPKPPESRPTGSGGEFAP